MRLPFFSNVRASLGNFSIRLSLHVVQELGDAVRHCGREADFEGER